MVMRSHTTTVRAASPEYMSGLSGLVDVVDVGDVGDVATHKLWITAYWAKYDELHTLFPVFHPEG